MLHRLILQRRVYFHEFRKCFIVKTLKRIEVLGELAIEIRRNSRFRVCHRRKPERAERRGKQLILDDSRVS